MRSLVLLLLVATSCRVAIPEGVLLCEDRHDCPPSWRCVDGRCRSMEVDAALVPDAGSDASVLPDVPELPDAPDAGSAVCASGHCYYRIGAMTWAGARASCMAAGDHLVTIDSAAEQDVVWMVSMGAGWIGATDEGSEASWRWVTGDLWTEPRWGATQPDNAGTGENCAALWPGFDGLWADLDCASVLPAVCEDGA